MWRRIKDVSVKNIAFAKEVLYCNRAIVSFAVLAVAHFHPGLLKKQIKYTNEKIITLKENLRKIL